MTPSGLRRLVAAAGLLGLGACGWAPPAEVSGALALARIAEHQARLGDAAGADRALARALQVAESRQEQKDRDAVRFAVAVAEARIGRLAEASNVAATIAEPGARIAAVLAVGAIALEGGGSEAAAEALAAARTVVDSRPDWADDEILRALDQIALFQAAMGDAAGALATAGRASASAESDPAAVLWLRAMIALIAVETAGEPAALAILAGIERDVAAVEARGEREEIAAALAGVRARAGDIDGALEAATATPVLEARAASLAYVAAARAARGDAAGAQATAGEAYRTYLQRPSAGAWFADAAEGMAPGAGAVVDGVDGEGAFAAAGIGVGEVVVQFDGIDVGSPDQLERLVGSRPAGTPIEVAVASDAGTRLARLVLGRADSAEQPTLSVLAAARAASGDVAGAVATADRIADSGDRIATHSMVAAMRASAGDGPGATVAADAACANAERLDATDSGSWSTAAARCAEARMAAGDGDGAIAQARRITARYDAYETAWIENIALLLSGRARLAFLRLSGDPLASFEVEAPPAYLEAVLLAESGRIEESLEAADRLLTNR